MVLFGSGGHSSEMLMLIRNANFPSKLSNDEINKIICVISEDDSLIEDKIRQEFPAIQHQSSKLDIIRLKRARRVGQSYLSAIWTTLVGLLNSISIAFYHEPQICLTNGPAISVTVSLAIRFLQALTLGRRFDCEIIYVESFCRTRTLSLSGKLIYHLRLANQFMVQWPALRDRYPRALYKGIVV